MNKYDRYWHSTEGIHLKLSKLKRKKFEIILYKYFFENYGFKGLLESYKIKDEDFAKEIIIGINFFNEDIQKWVRENILNRLNSKDIICRFIINLANSATKNDEKLATQFAECFVKTKLIKGISCEDGIFKIKTLDGRIISFSKRLNSEEEIDMMRSNCHQIMGDYFKKFQDDNDSYCMTILDRGLYGEPMYHSFLLYHGIVNDYARNFIMSWEDYKYLFNPEVIMCIPGKQLLGNLERLNKKDKDFNDSKMCAVLKYALNKQMKKEKRLKEV